MNVRSAAWYFDCQSWSIDRFGPIGSIWDTDVTWDANINSDSVVFLFEQDADATMFILKFKD